MTGVQSSYETLTLVRHMAPRFIKLDRNWLSHLADDPARRALIAAIVTVSAVDGPQIIAEGIETPEELDALRQLGVRFGQGFLLGRPSARPAQSPAAVPNGALVNH